MHAPSPARQPAPMLALGGLWLRSHGGPIAFGNALGQSLGEAMSSQADTVGPISAEERSSILEVFTDGPGGEAVPLRSSVSGKTFAEDVAERRGKVAASQYDAYRSQQDELDARVKGMMADAAAEAAAQRRFTDKLDAQDRRAAAAQAEQARAKPAVDRGGYGNSSDPMVNLLQYAQSSPALANDIKVYRDLAQKYPENSEKIMAALFSSRRAMMTLREDHVDQPVSAVPAGIPEMRAGTPRAQMKEMSVGERAIRNDFGRQLGGNLAVSYLPAASITPTGMVMSAFGFGFEGGKT